MSSPTTSKALSSAISLPESADGLSPLEKLVGPMIDLSGPHPAPVSPSPSPVKAKAKRTKGTSGQSSSNCSVPEGPLSSWESRLRQRLEKIGSTECTLTWKASVTPAGQSLSRLVPSMRPIGEIGFGLSLHLWPTPNASDEKWRYSTQEAALRRIETGKQISLECAAHSATLWPTPMARDHFPAHTPEYVAEKKALGHGMSNLNDTVVNLWPTPSVACATGGQSSRSGDRKDEMLLGGLVRETAALWPSPTASLSDKGIRSPEGAMTEIERGKSPDLAAHVMAMWSTPSKSDAIAGADFSRRDNGRPNSKVSTEVHLAEMWRTPRANDHKGGLRPDSKSERPTSDHFLPDQVNFATWPTPSASMMTGADLVQAMFAGSDPERPTYSEATDMASMWSTPSARDWKDSAGMAQTGVNPDGSTRTRLDQLPRQVALYPTPTSLAPARKGNNEAGNSAGLVAIRSIAIGMPQSGSSVQTEKPGALAPDFVAWLMGFPTTWLECAPEAMPKSRSKRSLSSPTASKPVSGNSEPLATPSSRTSPPKSSVPTSTPILDIGVFG